LRRRVLIIPSGRPSSCGTARRPLSPAFPRSTALPCRPVSPPSGPPVSPLEVTVLAIVCPGQGAQKPGFLSPWRELPGVEESLAGLSEAAGIDLLRHGTESDADTLRDTAVAQPLLVAAGITAADSLARRDGFAAGAQADLLAGHSVGEVTAAALSGVLTAEDAMRLVAVRSRAMATAAAAEPTSMAAVVGGTRDEVIAAIQEQGLAPANINSA